MALSALAGACADEPTGALTLPVQPAVSTSSTTTHVHIQGNTFIDPNITITAGDKVAWHNHDFTPHTASGDGGSFNTNTIGPNATVEVTFSLPGIYVYHCLIHATMTGSVTVQPDVPAAPLSITATAASASTVNVDWTPAGSNQTFFILQRRERVDGVWGSWARIAKPAGDATSKADAVSARRVFRYRIRACNANGCSTFVASNGVRTPRN